MADTLHAKKILITRQAEVAQELITLIKQHQGECELLPLFEIKPIVDDKLLTKIKHSLNAANLVIFISRNAVQIVSTVIGSLADYAVATIGPATAKYLQQKGCDSIIYPKTIPFDSESLVTELEAVELDFSQQKIIIFTGKDGNNSLEQALLQRGAKVELIAVYERQMPRFNSLPVVDIIFISCITSLVNLLVIANSLKVPIAHIPLLVVSERIYKKAIELGFVKVYTTKGMSNAAILDGLLRIGG